MGAPTSENTEYYPDASYDPVVGQSFSLDNLFGRDGYISQMKLPMSSDGSIYNLSAYYMYVRDAIIKRATLYYFI